jgi:hypothetical protein
MLLKGNCRLRIYSRAKSLICAMLATESRFLHAFEYPLIRKEGKEEREHIKSAHDQSYFAATEGHRTQVPRVCIYRVQKN